jgi:RNA polymerase sigma factor (sigma-70 family)
MTAASFEEAGTEIHAMDTLLSDAARGSRVAWEELVDRYSGLVWSVARSFRMNESDAGDVSQTTWLRLLEHISSIRQPELVGSWLATTARRESLRLLARNQRLVPSSPALEVDQADETLPPLDAQLIAEDERLLTRRAVEGLPAHWQDLVNLLASDPSPSYAEVAAHLGMPIGSIGPTRGRCLRRLRVALEQSDL